MRIKLLLSLLLFSSILLADQNSDDPDMGAEVLSIKSRSVFFEEWKYPGKYSPVKAFDGKTDTCAAEGRDDNWLSIVIKFSKEINIDEIRVMNGFGKSEELFRKNNRYRKLSIFFNSGEKLLRKEEVILKDQKEFQSVKFNGGYKTDWITFAAWGGGEECKGTSYDDTCITEIEFYYKGKKFEINNIDQLQKDYLKKLEATLIKAFTDRNYSEAQAGYSYIYFHKDGTVSFSDIMGCGENDFTCTSEFVPRYWKIEDLKLYMRNSRDEKWKLTKYDFLYDYDGENYFVRALTIYKNPTDNHGFVMRDVTGDKKVSDERKKRKKQEKKKSEP